ncbi:MAG TPA: circularly permuted type 2 ATP-grasp protein [Myxococcota bacterium]|nr:circularly permuted type 2 ATP-grasp protein [Myxococcota bacterium]
MTSDLFTDYQHGGFFDEVFDPKGEIRPHYAPLIERLRALPSEELLHRARLRDTILRNLGITFAVYGEAQGIERTWPLDLIPRIIPADEWRHVERGLVQRVRALNCFLEDLYLGERAALREGVIPTWLVQSSAGFCREAYGIPVPHGAHCLVAGIDVVRDGRGVYRVLEDNLRTPSGVSYVLENRATLTRVLPLVFAQHRVRPVNHYGASLLSALRHLAPPSASDPPCVVVLTPGIYNSAYFEHAFLARQMGIELVEGRDLVVDDHIVFMRTTRGLSRVDVIYRRVDDEFLDPAVFRSDSVLGVPGLLGAARAGNVSLANAIGNGVADDKAIYAYVPALVRFYLGEEPILPNVDTYLLWEAEQRAAALSRLHELVVKPVDASGGYGIVIGPKATEEELAAVRKAIEAKPRGYIAQEVVALSRHPTLVDETPRGGGRIEGRHIDLRPFVLTGEKIEVLPGGLTRVALRKDSLVVNSSQGGGSKDTWVLAADGNGAPV